MMKLKEFSEGAFDYCEAEPMPVELFKEVCCMVLRCTRHTAHDDADWVAQAMNMLLPLFHDNGFDLPISGIVFMDELARSIKNEKLS